MFTGLVEEVGEISNICNGRKSCILTVKCREVLKGTKIGDSIALNGVCLTVTTVGSDNFTADVMAETVSRSSLGELCIGTKVNLERAMPADGRFGGHIVSGHIDGIGKIKDIRLDENAVWYTVEASCPILKYIVEKGSITVDGISLTVAGVGKNDFKVSTIPHTRTVTNLAEKTCGDIVNLECDIIGKYVEKMLQPAESEKKESRITEAFLRENGF